MVLLRDQDRARWDRGRIVEGMALLGRALRSTPTTPNPYVVQAAMAACHAVAPTWEATNWAAIVSWYDVLVDIQDTPVVRLNRAVALSERDGPAAGLAELDALPHRVDGDLDGFAPYHGVRGQLLLTLGRRRDAEAELRRALAGPAPAAVKKHLRRELERCMTP